MRKENRFSSTIQIICIVLVLLVEKSMSSSNSSIDWVDIWTRRSCYNMFWESYIPVTLITRSDELKRETYDMPNKKYVLIKDLSPSSEVILIVSDITRNLESLFCGIKPYRKENINTIYTFYYPKTNENENNVTNNSLNEEKRMFVVPHYKFERDILINRIEAAEDKNQYELGQIEKGMKYLLRVIGMMICKNYINEHEEESAGQIQTLSNILDDLTRLSIIKFKHMIIKNPELCSLLGKVLLYNDQKFSKTLETLEYSEKVLDEILKDKRLVRPSNIQKTFDEDTDTLTNQLKYSEREYMNCKLEEIYKMVINIVSNGKLDSDINKSMEKQKEEEEELKHGTEVWNRTLLEMLIKIVKRISESNQDITYENICEDNRALIEEVNKNRIKCYNERKNIAILEGIFRRDIARIKDILKNQENSTSITDRNTIQESTINMNKQIINILSKISADEKNDLNESAQKKEKIEDILADIENEVSVSGNEDIILEIIGEKKQTIVDVILESLPITNNEDAIRIKNQLEQAVASIVDNIVKERINPENPKILTALKKEIEKEERNITQNSIDDLMSIHRLVEKLAYKKDINDHLMCAVDGYDMRILRFLKMINNNESVHEWLIKNITPNDISQSDIIGLYQFLYYIHSYIHNLRSYAMIWTNPAFLTIESNENSGCISYKSELDGKLYKKTITQTEENIQAFRNAKTSEDIDKIEGTSEEICI